MVNKRKIRLLLNKNKKSITILLIIFIFLILLTVSKHISPPTKVSAFPESASIWQIRSIDTMKTSRDNARSELHNSRYNSQIQNQLTAIKQTGANYVAIDTPYDNEFLPYLTRWVTLARQTGLHVWFRGNFSSWEGWFDYPKNMTPQEHTTQIIAFIVKNPDLFEDGDIFDPCPECENAGFWPQPDANVSYQDFIQSQQKETVAAFAKIGKQVSVYPSIIGGRAKDVLGQKTFNALDNIIPIDHYFSDPQSITDYIQYFSQNFHTKVLVSEFGAPIPTINGNMTDTEQADFISSVFSKLYQQHNNVLGVNYYVIEGGTTGLLHDDSTAKPALAVVSSFYTPTTISGTVRNDLGEVLPNIAVQTQHGYSESKTNSQGRYNLVIPQVISTKILAINNKYKKVKVSLKLDTDKHIYSHDFVLSPVHPDVWYKLHLFFNTKIRSLDI